VRVIGEDHIRENPDEIPDAGFLPDMDIAMEPDEITNPAMPLDVAQCSDLEILSGARLLSHGDAMAGGQVLIECRAFIKDAVGADEAVFPIESMPPCAASLAGQPNSQCDPMTVLSPRDTFLCTMV
jgi:hypothetical protein